MPAASPVKVQLFDVNGRRVAMLGDELRAAGRNEIAWNTGGLRPGVYVMDIEAAGRHERTHVVVLR